MPPPMPHTSYSYALYATCMSPVIPPMPQSHNIPMSPHIHPMPLPKALCLLRKTSEANIYFLKPCQKMHCDKLLMLDVQKIKSRNIFLRNILLRNNTNPLPLIISRSVSEYSSHFFVSRSKYRNLIWRNLSLFYN